MENIVNTRHDAGGYDQSGYKHAIYDGNVLYEAFLKAKKGSDWKGSVQRFEMDYLFGLAKIQKELQEETYRFKEGSSFIIRERGKVRKITGEKIDDRIVKHALCDEVINPAIKKYLIHDNGASQVGKGIEFTRRRLEQHLHQYYRRDVAQSNWICRNSRDWHSIRIYLYTNRNVGRMICDGTDFKLCKTGATCCGSGIVLYRYGTEESPDL